MEELYRNYYAGAILYCTALCGNPTIAEDIVADAFVKAYLSLPNEVPSFQYWLLRVCRNLWLDQLRRSKHFASDAALEFIPDHRTPESVYLENERLHALWAAITSLSPLDRELVTLHYFMGLPLHEIAVIIGKSYTAVRQRLSRLRKTLRQRMEEQGYGF